MHFIPIMCPGFTKLGHYCIRTNLLIVYIPLFVCACTYTRMQTCLCVDICKCVVVGIWDWAAIMGVGAGGLDGLLGISKTFMS